MLMWDHGPWWRLPGFSVKMNKSATNWFSQSSQFGHWSRDMLKVESTVVTWIQNFPPFSIPRWIFVQKLNECFPTFICFYLTVCFLLLLKTRKKAKMPRGSPFLGCPQHSFASKWSASKFSSACTFARDFLVCCFLVLFLCLFGCFGVFFGVFPLSYKDCWTPW